jgi:predicted enzyme related to lactoylglutathione lyase
MQATTTVGRVVWHELATTDVDRAVAFYRDLLGLGIQIWKPGEADYPMIEVHGTTHGGFQPAPDGTPSHWFGHVRVDDVDAAAERATSLGATVLAGPMEMPDIGRFALVGDPYGAVFSLYRPAGDGSGSDAVFAWDEVLTPDVETTAAFYREVVGWTSDESGPEGYVLFHRADGSPVAGCMRKPGGVPGPAMWITYLATDDVDETSARARELGGTVLREPFDIPEICRIAVLADPTGAVFGLFRAAG